ncbi:hypothetical protein [Nonomuraea angiospora]
MFSLLNKFAGAMPAHRQQHLGEVVVQAGAECLRVPAAGPEVVEAGVAAPSFRTVSW